MPSPFPGMDPYLEGYLWPDVHHRLATAISSQLAPQIQPKYVARLDISVIEDESPEAEIGVMYPDVEVIQRKEQEAAPIAAGAVAARIVAPVTLKLPRVKLVTVEIRDVAQNLLVTSIEILSPVNKREPHLSRYRAKRDRLRAADVHLLEIDLLRRGTRVWTYAHLPDAPYLIALTRAASDEIGLWPVPLDAPLPRVPVPLRTPDEDAVLDLGDALTSVYEAAFYHLSIDYSQEPPPPSLSAEAQAIVQTFLEAKDS